MRGIGQFTKTGRSIQLGRQFGEWTAKDRSSKPTVSVKKPEYNIYIKDNRIEILDGLKKDNGGNWIKEDLEMLEPSTNPNNLYKNPTQIWANKRALMTGTDAEKRTILSAIRFALFSDLSTQKLLYCLIINSEKCGHAKFENGELLLTVNYFNLFFQIIIQILFIFVSLFIVSVVISTCVISPPLGIMLIIVLSLIS